MAIPNPAVFLTLIRETKKVFIQKFRPVRFSLGERFRLRFKQI